MYHDHMRTFISVSLQCQSHVCAFFFLMWRKICNDRSRSTFFAANCYPMLYPIGYSLHLSDVIKMFPHSSCLNLQKEKKLWKSFFLLLSMPNASKLIPTGRLDTINKRMMMMKKKSKTFFLHIYVYAEVLLWDTSTWFTTEKCTKNMSEKCLVDIFYPGQLCKLIDLFEWSIKKSATLWEIDPTGIALNGSERVYVWKVSESTFRFIPSNFFIFLYPFAPLNSSMNTSKCVTNDESHFRSRHLKMTINFSFNRQKRMRKGITQWRLK